MTSLHVVSFARRDRSFLQTMRASYWRRRKSECGLGEGMRVAEEMRRSIRRRLPEWPGADSRIADLEVHMRVGEMLWSVGPLRSR
jgi:hypothetical protein